MRVAIDLHPRLAERLMRQAEHECRNVHQQASWILEEALRKDERQPEPTQICRTDAPTAA